MERKVGFYHASDKKLYGALLEERNLYLFSYVTTVVTIIYGIAYIYYGFGLVLNSLFIAAGVVIGLNAAIFRWHRNFNVASTIYVVLTLLALFLSFLHGGFGATLMVWLPPIPASIFLFSGIKRGLIFNSFFIGTIILFIVLHRFFGIGVYHEVQLFHVLMCTLIFTFAGFIGQRRHEMLGGELSSQRQRMRDILEKMPAGVIVAEAPAGRIVAINSGAVELLGLVVSGSASVASMIDRCHILQPNGQPYPINIFPLTIAMNDGIVSVRNDLVIQRADGTRTVLRLAAAPVHDAHGSVTAIVGVIEDASKEFEVDQMKSEFVALASHQLKTPLTSIRWAAEAMGDGKSNLDKEQVEYVDVILTTVERLNRLVSDLLNVSHIETGRKFNLVQKPTDIVPLLTAAAREVAQSAIKHKVNISTSTLPTSLMLNIDSDKVKELFLNLIGNAVKYSHDGGHVDIGWENQPSFGSAVVVRDDGIGIPKIQQERIFGKFFRADNVPQETEGTGLGLYIAKAIVEKQGGKIWFSSEEGKGTTFYVQLPEVEG